MPRLRKPPQEEQPEPEVVENAATEDGGRVIELAEGASDGVTVELNVAPVPEKKEEVAPAVPEDNPVQRAADADKRAQELQHVQRQLVEAQRQRDLAVRQTRERDDELIRERSDRQQAEYDSVLNAIGGQQAAADKAQADYEAAIAAGDSKAAGQSQRVMARLEATLVALEDRKAFLDQGRQQQEKRQQPQQQLRPQQQPQLSVEQLIQQVPNGDAQAWLRKHPEFMNDPNKNKQIRAAHEYLINTRGIAEFSPTYFDALDTEFGFKAQQQNQQPVQTQPQQRSIPVAAPVSRDVPTANGQRATSRQMHLTREEVDVAHRSRPDLPKAQAERLYAEKKQLLNSRRANGEYPQSERN